VGAMLKTASPCSELVNNQRYITTAGGTER
jgi:hypothetical protein